MAPPLQHDGYGRDRGEQDEAEGERRPRPPQLHERGLGQGREVGPPMEVRRPKRRADDEEGERQEHPRRAAPDRKGVPEAQPPPSCMPRPKMKAPTTTET